MSSYIKIHSKVEIELDNMPLSSNGTYFFDYDRQEDDIEEDFRYEYFFELDDEYDNDELLQQEFQRNCLDAIIWLNANIGADNYSITNMSGIEI